MIEISREKLMHYGVSKLDGAPVGSGRYPLGSGENPNQHRGDFLSRYEELKKQNPTYTDEAGHIYTGDTAIAKIMGMSTTAFRVEKQLANHERRRLQSERARTLRDEGKTLKEIADIMGFNNDSSVRALLNEKTAERANMAEKTAEILKEELKNKGMLDVGAGVEKELGISETKMKEALYILEQEGYHVYPIGVPQVTNPGQQSNTKVLCGPDVAHKDVYNNMGNIQSVGDYYSMDGGSTWHKLQYPASIDSERVNIRYGDEGGLNKDGVIELRRGVPDLDLGNSHYAQVRILVDGTHYIKGMAMYSDDIPDGVDIVFNTNKKSGTDKMDVLKPIENDPDNPFGALIKANGQSVYIDKNGKERLSAINKLKEEGDWDTMSRNLSSQFLSKQPMHLIRKQLSLTYSDAEATFDEICSLENPTIKRKMLLDFADECDSATVHLKAAALPRQSTKVILPLDCMKETEVYAPTYNNGEKVALIRYPHAGTFEIPILTVNNKGATARNILGNVSDAVGINAKVAERLSGADFDGDQVVVIPLSDRVKITSSRALDGLKGFDPKNEYPYREGMKVMGKDEKQKQMGVVSNLITDMTLRGAPESDIVKAVKHSMVVIDAEKHKLDYKRSEKENEIALLKKKYQKHYDEDGELLKEGGASTLISKKKQEVRVPERKGSGKIDPDTGQMVYKESGRTYIDKKTGKTVPAVTKVSLMSITDDARSLSSGTPQENAYAEYANKMKSLAGRARREYLATEPLKYSSSAHEAYRKEANTLKAKLHIASLNAPKERRAQAIANSEVKAKCQANPELNKDKKELKKVRQIAITKARASVGASRKDTLITITDREWEAIQAGAISDTNLTKILRYADQEQLKQRATPKSRNQLSDAKINKIKAMVASGYTYAEIAKAVGCSPSTVSKHINS